MVDPWPEHIEAIRKDGLAIEGVTEEEFVCARPKTMHLTELQQQVPRSTRGEGVLEYAFARYEPLDPLLLIPERTRIGPNPLNRKEYLGALMRR